MAGKLIVDTIDTDNAFITLNVQQSLIATMNVSGIYSNTGVQMIGANGTVSNTAITGNIISSQITSVANTQITGNIVSSQITSVANTQITGNLTATNIAGGTNGTIPYQSANGTTQMLAVGTAGQLLQTNGAGAPTWATVSAGFTLGTPVVSTSGTSITFTGIPAGVKQIIVNFSRVSTSGTSAKVIQLGDSGGIETTGYLSSGVSFIPTTMDVTSSITSFIIRSLVADEVLSGSVVFTLENASTYKWVATGIMSGSGAGAGNMFWNAGEKSLSAELTQLRITTNNGTDTFDGGEINIAYI